MTDIDTHGVYQRPLKHPTQKGETMACDPAKGQHSGGVTVTTHSGWTTVTCNGCGAIFSQGKGT